MTEDGELPGPAANELEPLPMIHLGQGRYEVQLPELDYGRMLAPKRHSEVAMVVSRMPGWLLMQTKAHYPPGVFRIPTGTADAEETAEQTMLRELREEANLVPGQFRELFRLDYRVGRTLNTFHTHAFFIEQPEGELRPVDTSEGITAWREAQVSDLPAVAAELRRLEPPRRAWGIFRSALHQLLADVLRRQEAPAG